MQSYFDFPSKYLVLSNAKENRLLYNKSENNTYYTESLNGTSLRNVFLISYDLYFPFKS